MEPKQINPKELKVASGRDPLRYPKVQSKIEEGSVKVFDLMTTKITMDITKAMVNILKAK